MVNKIKNLGLVCLSISTLLLYILYSNSQGNAGRLSAELEETLYKSAELRKTITSLEVERERLLIESSDKNRVVTVVETRPDGTRIETTDRSEERTKVFDETTDKVKEAREDVIVKTVEIEKVVERGPAVRYSMGAYAPARLERPDPFDMTYTMGVRLGDLPVWGELGYAAGTDTILIGGRYEW